MPLLSPRFPARRRARDWPSPSCPLRLLSPPASASPRQAAPLSRAFNTCSTPLYLKHSPGSHCPSPFHLSKSQTLRAAVAVELIFEKIPTLLLPILKYTP